MKKKSLYLLLIVTIVLPACSQDNLDLTQNSKLKSEEISDLLLLREEEKLARDVYLHAYEIYGKQNFSNIAASEQRHMDKVLDLIVQYNLIDPVIDEPGLFSNKEYQELYDLLVIENRKSLKDALLSGAKIEDLDIFDLNRYLTRTDNTDIINLYEKLMCGSRNHMRSFVSQLEREGIAYSPMYISNEDFNEIINGAHERCGVK